MLCVMGIKTSEVVVRGCREWRRVVFRANVHNALQYLGEGEKEEEEKTIMHFLSIWVCLGGLNGECQNVFENSYCKNTFPVVVAVLTNNRVICLPIGWLCLLSSYHLSDVVYMFLLLNPLWNSSRTLNPRR